jgi:hypothetical protein
LAPFLTANQLSGFNCAIEAASVDFVDRHTQLLQCGTDLAGGVAAFLIQLPLRAHVVELRETWKLTPDRSKIDLHDARQIKYWTRALGIGKVELLEAINRLAMQLLA